MQYSASILAKICCSNSTPSDLTHTLYSEVILHHHFYTLNISWEIAPVPSIHLVFTISGKLLLILLDVVNTSWCCVGGQSEHILKKKPSCEIDKVSYNPMMLLTMSTCEV